MAKNWNSFYKKGCDLEFFIQNITCHMELFKSIVAEKPQKILEVGTGTGSMSVFLSFLGFDVVSLDNNPQVLCHTKGWTEEIDSKVKFVLGNAFKIPFADNSFDVVFHQGLLEHFTDEEIIKLLDEQLRVGKIVILSVPNNFYPKKDLGNERLMPQEYWQKLLEKYYKILENKEYNPDVKTLLGGRIIYRAKNTMYLAKCTK